MAEYKDNSHRAREEKREEPKEEKKVEKVVSGTTKRRKKTGLNKAADSFLQNDVHSVWGYLVEEILIPAAKRTLTDTFHNFVDMMIYGEAKGTRDPRNGGSTRAAYYTFYDDRRGGSRERAVSRSRSRSSYGFDDVLFDSRGDCEAVLDRMDEIIQDTGAVSVAEYLELAGYDPEHTDWKYGWDSLRGATPKRVSDGYIITMPRASLID